MTTTRPDPEAATEALGADGFPVHTVRMPLTPWEFRSGGADGSRTRTDAYVSPRSPV
ncbi:hypothetical protein [Streptomyces sp. BA2]|uniref:hypothetical protein n=1 Tax=Streptomyces sp. BA2 TaxID=436595 RepID=UPI0013207566|nr:hypothetical protein [Streptomyces sp. BA2]MWA14629.1 hypothetical protein [Streptomyces sp. BA2]